MQYAAKVSGSVRGWDLSGSYFDGWEDVPHVRRELTIGDAGTRVVRIAQEYLRKRSVGGDFATVVGPFTVRGEAALIRLDHATEPDYFQYVLGLERTFGDMMAAGGTFILVQWIQTVLPDDFVPPPLDFNYLFQKSTTVRVQRNLTAAAQVVVEGLYEWANRGIMSSLRHHISLATTCEWRDLSICWEDAHLSSSGSTNRTSVCNFVFVIAFRFVSHA